MKLTRPKFNIWSFILALFPVATFFSMVIPGFSFLAYYDEIVSMACLAVVIVLLLCNRLTEYDTYIAIIIAFITVLGIFSNLFSNLLSSPFPIIVDALWLWKPFAIYIFFKFIAFKKNQREKILTELTDYSRFTILITFIICVIGQFANIGVTSSYETVFGIFKQYDFFWNNAIQTGWLLIGPLMVLSVTLERKMFLRYFVISCFPLALTGSSMIYCWILLVIILQLIFSGRYKFKVWHILVIAPIIVLVNYADVESYIFQESIRKTFFEKSVEVANKYFPFGSGFATFGSEMAKRYYSQLYIDWGWENDWSFGRQSGYLNDTFFSSIIGQFGWIGILLYVIALIFVFIQANNKELKGMERTICIATMVTLAVTMIGSATAKSMMGIYIFALLGILSGKQQKQYEGIRLKR